MSLTRILLSAGELEIAEALRKALSTEHYLVDLAPDGVVSKQWFDSRSYDLALIDFHLPGISGCEISTYMRKKNSVAGFPGAPGPGDRSPILIRLFFPEGTFRTLCNIPSA